jgi:hypothetical protein
MALKTLWNALWSAERRSAVSSASASPALQTILEGLQEQRRIIDHLKRYEDVTYACVVRRFAFLQQELATIFRGPATQGLADRRVQERRKTHRPVAWDRRRGVDRRMSP